MSNATQFSKSEQPEKEIENPSESNGCGPIATGEVNLISKDNGTGNSVQKIKSQEGCVVGEAERNFIAAAPAMELRERYKAEANAHKNMLSRSKRGVTVHPDLRKFRSFLLHVGPMPGKRMTLDRINNHDPEYAPGKVRWADRYTQNNNKSDTLTFYSSRTNETYTCSRVANLQKVSKSAIRKRRYQGWSDDEIVEGTRASTVKERRTTIGESKNSETAGRFPAGLYTARQLALLSRREAELTHGAEIQFHREAHYRQSYRDEYGEEDFPATLQELRDILGYHANGITEEGYRHRFLQIWGKLRPHIVYRSLKPHQKEMLVEYDPEWVASQERREWVLEQYEDCI